MLSTFMPSKLPSEPSFPTNAMFTFTRTKEMVLRLPVVMVVPECFWRTGPINQCAIFPFMSKSLLGAVSLNLETPVLRTTRNWPKPSPPSCQFWGWCPEVLGLVPWLFLMRWLGLTGIQLNLRQHCCFEMRVCHTVKRKALLVDDDGA